MVRRSRRNQASTDAANEGDPPTEQDAESNNDATANGGRSVAPHVREWQRRVAEREANRLARPEASRKATLDHADRTKSAVSSTPFGYHAKRTEGEDDGVIIQEEWCGPFSVARQMIAKREEARRQREAEQQEQAGMSHPLDEAMCVLDQERKRKAHPSLQWKSNVLRNNLADSSSIYAKRQKRQALLSQGRAVPSLFDLCIQFLVENFEEVECLGDVDNSIRTALAKELVEQNKLNGESFRALAEAGIETLEYIDCSQVTQDQLADALKKLIPAGLRYLLLDQSGRCFGPKTVNAIAETISNATSETDPTSSFGLFALSVGGAYLLNDTAAATMIVALSKTVSSLEFKACPLLRKNFCQSISDSFAFNSNLVELALEDLNLNAECLDALVSKPGAMKNVKSLSLRRIEGVNDDRLATFLKITGDTLERLDISYNYTLSDAVLAALRQNNPNLKALSLAGLKHLTAQGLEALFTHVSGMAPPPMLRSLDVSNCDHEAFTDDVMQLVTQAATTRRNESGIDQLELMGGIVNLNLLGSTVVTDAALEHLVSTSAKTLQNLDVSFCSKITDQGMGYLVDQCGNQLSNIQIWGCAQLTDDFLDGHRRTNDPTLTIAGAWMKKSTTRTIR